MDFTKIPFGVEWLIVAGFILFLAGLIPFIFYLRTLQATLRLVSPELRQMRPGQVWLLLIPLFSLVWNFIVVTKISDSIRAEAIRRNVPLAEARPGYGIGLSMCICSCIFFIPLINILSNIAVLICWILYWVKINEYKKMLSIHYEPSGIF